MSALRLRLAWLVAALAVTVAAGCGNGDGNGEGKEGGVTGARTITVDGEAIPASRLTDALQGLCDAGAEARGDVGTARATFYDRSHDDLHVLARALDPVDPSTAARLLEAKQRVESGLDARPPPPTLSDDIAALVTATRAGLGKLSVPGPDCPDAP